MRKNKYACVLTIAGSDSSGGAGIQADIKTISATGCYAASIITALTAQNTLGVQAIHEISSDFVAQQIESVFTDLSIQAVKIGMLYNKKIISVVSFALKKFKPNWVVLDPVMISKNGYPLFDFDSIEFLKKNLFPYANLITPNLMEAEKLVGIAIKNPTQQALAAQEIGDQFHLNVLVKGGHLEGEQSSDVLYLKQEKKCYWFHAARIQSRHTHGTGCSLSSAIASYLAQEYLLEEAINAAKNYLTNAIEHGKTKQIGRGCGPVDHFYFLQNQKREEKKWTNFL